LIASLEGTYSEVALTKFFKYLEIFRNCHVDRAKVFDAMDGLIGAGRKLVEFDASAHLARCVADEENRG
jgi:hypothetical protein